MPDAPASAAAASVLFLNVAGLAKRPVAEQARVKERLEALVARVLAPLAAADRIVADQVDGIAVALLASPADALQAARRARRMAARHGRESLPLRVSLNHGLLRVAPDDHGELWLTGDAIAAGASIAGFTEPGRILASRSFRDALQPADPERAAHLRPAGTFTDAALRAHELYAFEPSAADLGATLGAAGTRRRRLALIGTLSVVGVLAAGFAARAARRAAAQARRPAVVELAIAPWGAVFIDGESRGRSPPLQRLEIAAGQHTIEIRHPPQPPVTLQVVLDPGEALTVRHSFAAPAPAPKPALTRKPAPPPVQEKPSAIRRAWNDFRKSLPF
jgi:hypothetical protein